MSRSCCVVEDVALIHVEVAKKEFGKKDLFVGTSLIDGYARFGAMADAHAIFRKLPVKNIVSWTALISGYAELGPNLEFLKCFEDIRANGISPNYVTYM
mgnify:CR=1 FL=1